MLVPTAQKKRSAESQPVEVAAGKGEDATSMNDDGCEADDSDDYAAVAGRLQDSVRCVLLEKLFSFTHSLSP